MTESGSIAEAALSQAIEPVLATDEGKKFLEAQERMEMFIVREKWLLSKPRV